MKIPQPKTTARIRRELQASRDRRAADIAHVRTLSHDAALDYLDGRDLIDAIHVVREAYGFIPDNFKAAVARN